MCIIRMAYFIFDAKMLHKLICQKNKRLKGIFFRMNGYGKGKNRMVKNFTGLNKNTIFKKSIFVR